MTTARRLGIGRRRLHRLRRGRVAALRWAAWPTRRPGRRRRLAVTAGAGRRRRRDRRIAPASRRAASGRPRAGADAPRRIRVTRRERAVLYYHRVRAAARRLRGLVGGQRRRSSSTYDTLPQAFAAQLDWLRAHGYTTILPRDLAAHWDTATPLPARPVIITFDDGSHDWVQTVLPMLQARGMVAEFYLTLDAIKHGNLTWNEVRRLATAGNGIGAHDVHHVQLTASAPARRTPSPATMWSEVNGARQIIGATSASIPIRWPTSAAATTRRSSALVAGGRLHSAREHRPRDRPERGPPLSDAGRPDRRPRRRRQPRQRRARPGPADVHQADGRRSRQVGRRARPGPIDRLPSAMDTPRLTVAITVDHDAISDSIRRGDPPVKFSHAEFGAAGRHQAHPRAARRSRRSRPRSSSPATRSTTFTRRHRRDPGRRPRARPATAGSTRTSRSCRDDEARGRPRAIRGGRARRDRCSRRPASGRRTGRSGRRRSAWSRRPASSTTRR